MQTKLQKMRGGVEKEALGNKVKTIEDRLKAEKFTAMFLGDDMNQSLEANKSSTFSNKTFMEDMERKHRDRIQNEAIRQDERNRIDDLLPSNVRREREELAEREAGRNGVVASSIIPSVVPQVVQQEEEEIIEIDTSMPVRGFGSNPI